MFPVSCVHFYFEYVSAGILYIGLMASLFAEIVTYIYYAASFFLPEWFVFKVTINNEFGDFQPGVCKTEVEKGANGFLRHDLFCFG